MEAEILDRPPLSGDFEEHHFSGSGNTLWVRFLDQSYLEWVGVFGQSRINFYNVVLQIPGEPLVFVVAGGQGYFVDPNVRKVVATTEWDCIENVIYNDDTGLFVVTDGLCLALFNWTQLVWSGDRVSVDGIYFTGQSGAVIRGVLNDLTEKGCEFTFNARTCEFKTDWVLAEHWGRLT